jgi:hypothetical protein
VYVMAGAPDDCCAQVRGVFGWQKQSYPRHEIDRVLQSITLDDLCRGVTDTGWNSHRVPAMIVSYYCTEYGGSMALAIGCG